MECLKVGLLEGGKVRRLEGRVVGRLGGYQGIYVFSGTFRIQRIWRFSCFQTLLENAGRLDDR